MGKIKGWKLNIQRKSYHKYYNFNATKRNQYAVIEYGKTKHPITGKNVYSVAFYNPFKKEGDIPDLILRYDTIEKARNKAINYMRSHPNG